MIEPALHPPAAPLGMIRRSVGAWGWIEAEHGLQRLPGPLQRPIAWLLLLPVLAYRRFVSRWLPPACRFHPSCSHYAVLTLAQQRPPVALALTTWRLLRCQPMSRGGLDWPRPGPHARLEPAAEAAAAVSQEIEKS
jgi:putative membrane protein insertion efficiency factor